MILLGDTMDRRLPLCDEAISRCIRGLVKIQSQYMSEDQNIYMYF